MLESSHQLRNMSGEELGSQLALENLVDLIGNDGQTSQQMLAFSFKDILKMGTSHDGRGAGTGGYGGPLFYNVFEYVKTHKIQSLIFSSTAGAVTYVIWS